MWKSRTTISWWTIFGEMKNIIMKISHFLERASWVDSLQNFSKSVTNLQGWMISRSWIKITNDANNILHFTMIVVRNTMIIFQFKYHRQNMCYYSSIFSHAWTLSILLYVSFVIVTSFVLTLRVYDTYFKYTRAKEMPVTKTIQMSE